MATDELFRHVDLRITAPAETGFLVWEGGEVIAAFTSRSELAQWLEDRLGLIPGEREKEAQAMAEMQNAMTNVERMPNVVRPRTEPSQKRGYFARG